MDYQLVGFHFRVKFLNLPEDKKADIKFQSVSGLDVELDKETIREGGENRFEHNVYTRTKYSNLSLKRGMLTPNDSSLTNWLQSAFQNLNILPIARVDVELLNEHHNVLMSWQLSHVWPVSWKVAELNAERGEVLIETLELNYNYFKLVAEA